VELEMGQVIQSQQEGHRWSSARAMQRARTPEEEEEEGAG